MVTPCPAISLTASSFARVLHTGSGGTVSKWFPKYDPRDEGIGWKNIYEGSETMRKMLNLQVLSASTKT